MLKTVFIASAATLVLSLALSATARQADAAEAAGVATFAAGQGFSLAVEGTRFAGSFAKADGACEVTVISAAEDPEHYAPSRSIFRIAAMDVQQMKVADRALAIGCVAGAAAIKVGEVAADPTRLAAR